MTTVSLIMIRGTSSGSRTSSTSKMNTGTTPTLVYDQRDHEDEHERRLKDKHHGRGIED